MRRTRRADSKTRRRSKFIKVRKTIPRRKRKSTRRKRKQRRRRMTGAGRDIGEIEGLEIAEHHHGADGQFLLIPKTAEVIAEMRATGHDTNDDDDDDDPTYKQLRDTWLLKMQKDARERASADAALTGQALPMVDLVNAYTGDVLGQYRPRLRLLEGAAARRAVYEEVAEEMHLKADNIHNLMRTKTKFPVPGHKDLEAFLRATPNTIPPIALFRAKRRPGRQGADSILKPIQFDMLGEGGKNDINDGIQPFDVLMIAPDIGDPIQQQLSLPGAAENFEKRMGQLVARAAPLEEVVAPVVTAFPTPVNEGSPLAMAPAQDEDKEDEDIDELTGMMAALNLGGDSDDDDDGGGGGDGGRQGKKKSRWEFSPGNCDFGGC